MLERRQASLVDGQVMDKMYHWTTDATAPDTYEMSVYDEVVIVDTTLGIGTLSLPPVSQAAGKFYAVLFKVDGGDLTLQDLDDSYNWKGDYVLTDAGQCYLFYSDSEAWHVLATKAAI